MPGVPGGPSDMVTAVVTATPDVFGGKMPWTLRDSGPPWSAVPGTGAGGDQSLASPRGPVSVVSGEQWRAPGVLK